MKVTVDRNRCTGIGICESLSPDIFEVDDDGQLIVHQESFSESEGAAIDEAVRSCPAAALTLLREG